VLLTTGGSYSCKLSSMNCYSNYETYLTRIRFTTPGGYFEITDVTFPCECDDGTMGPDSALRKWSNLLLDVGKKTGRDLDAAKSYKEEMEKAGFTDIGVRVDMWPMNRWPKGDRNKELGMNKIRANEKMMLTQ
jgi:hypothetical protein